MIADEITLARLAASAQKGERQGYGVLLKQSEGWLRRYFGRRIPPHHLDDLVQDTLLSLHAKLGSYDPDRPFLPWLAAIARYRWVDHLRKVYRAEEVALDNDLPQPSDEDETIARISLERLFAQLSPAQARAIEMVKIEGRSVEEAAQGSGQSASLIKVNIHRGLKKLASLIERAE